MEPLFLQEKYLLFSDMLRDRQRTFHFCKWYLGRLKDDFENEVYFNPPAIYTSLVEDHCKIAHGGLNHSLVCDLLHVIGLVEHNSGRY